MEVEAVELGLRGEGEDGGEMGQGGGRHGHGNRTFGELSEIGR